MAVNKGSFEFLSGIACAHTKRSPKTKTKSNSKLGDLSATNISVHGRDGD